jgi:hypothetical protein
MCDSCEIKINKFSLNRNLKKICKKCNLEFKYSKKKTYCNKCGNVLLYKI